MTCRVLESPRYIVQKTVTIVQFNRAFFKFDSLDPILGFLHQWDETLYSTPVGRETNGGELCGSMQASKANLTT